MMKTLVMGLFIFSLGFNGLQAQGMPVYDNTNFLALGQQLIESAKQTSELFKTVRFLKEQKEKVEQVSAVLKQLRMVREIVENNQHLYRTVEGDLIGILESPYIKPEEIDRISHSFTSLVNRALEDLEFMQELLTSNYLNMSDAERLNILEVQRTRSREMAREIDLKKKRYQMIIDFRKQAASISERTSAY